METRSANGMMERISRMDRLAALLIKYGTKLRELVAKTETCADESFLSPELEDAVVRMAEAIDPSSAVLARLAKGLVEMSVIVRIVARSLGVTQGKMRSSNRAQHVAFARHLSMYLCREMTELSKLRPSLIAGSSTCFAAMSAPPFLVGRRQYRFVPLMLLLYLDPLLKGAGKSGIFRHVSRI